MTSTKTRPLDHTAVQRGAPYGPTEPKRKIRLHFEQIHPVLRIVHIYKSILTVPERIIYDHELLLMQKGASTFTIGGRTRSIEPGTLLFIPPFTPHSFQTPDRTRSEHIAVHFDYCAFELRQDVEAVGREPYEIIWPGGRTPPALTTLAPGHWIEQTLREIVDLHASEGDPLSAIEASCRFTRILAQLLRWGAGADAGAVISRVNHDRIARVLEYIGANLASTLSVDELANIADVGRSRFVTLFREATGDSPQHYIQQRRVAEARRLLADPSLQIKQIAAMTGFEDRFYFTKVFRRVDGLTPTQFRAAALLGRGGVTEE
jgi:AraC-like DNA-binding protein